MFKLTDAMSTLMPFALPLYVGGNKLRSPKWMVCPAVAAPLTVTVKRLFVLLGAFVACSLVVNCVHAVFFPEMVRDLLARTTPEELVSAIVKGPENVVAVGKR